MLGLKFTNMQDLFSPAVSGKIVSRMEQLKSTSQPLWGKMNVAQMLAHCQAPLQVALKEKKLKRNLFGILFGKMAKKKLTSGKPFPRNLPTDKSFLVTDERKFEEEKSKLITLINRFTAAGGESISKETHPFFGKMTPEEWGILSYKHLDHHLQQFGV